MKSALLFLAVNILVTQLHCAHALEKDDVKPRIVGGVEAEEFDLQDDLHGVVSLQIQGSHFCGGTWVRVGNISQIITAAHCVYMGGKSIIAANIVEVVGDDLKAPIKYGGDRRQVRGVIKIVGYPKFKSVRSVGAPTESIQYDIAVLILKSPFKETNTFRPVKLSKEPIKDNQECRVAGWGNLNERGYSPKSLMTVNMTVIPKSVCNAPYAYGGAVANHAFCAGSMEGGIDSCQGDSGGGVLSNGKLVGVVSFGLGCARRGYPGVYTDTQRFNEWIGRTFNASPVLSQSNVLMLITAVVAILTQMIAL